MSSIIDRTGYSSYFLIRRHLSKKGRRFAKTAGAVVNRESVRVLTQSSALLRVHKQKTPRGVSFVDRTGLEPATPSLQMMCSTR